MPTQGAGLTVVAHPLVQHKLSLMRDRSTSTAEFRRLLREISLLLAYEATRELPLEPTEIDTPLERARFPALTGKKLCLVSILRAGTGLLDGMLQLVPSARVGHIGIYRDPRTLQAIEYYLKQRPTDSAGDRILPQAAGRPGGARRGPLRSDARHRQLGGGGDLAPQGTGGALD